MTDEELLEAWRAGDRQAGNTLFERYFRTLYGFFRNKVSDGVDDLVQQTFLACVRGREGFRQESTFRTYMFGAAKNILYNEWKRRRKVDSLVDFNLTSVHDLSPGLSTAYARHREQRLILDALRRIPLDFQVAVELYYFEGFRGPEIAQILEVPEATVRSRLDRGIKQLRRSVEELAASPELLQSTIEKFEEWTQTLRKAVISGDGAPQ